jgi:hypothetical protein
MNETAGQPKVVVEDPQTRMWGMLCHLTALVGLIGVPFGNLLGPLVVWLLKKNEMAVVNEEGKKSLNFQLTMTIGLVIAGLLCFLLIGFPLLIGLAIADLILVIMASIKVNNGEKFQYPFSLEILK